MQQRVLLCVPKHSTIKPRGEPFSAAPALIQQTWCAQMLITEAHMYIFYTMQMTLGVCRAAAITCCCRGKQRLAQAPPERAASGWSSAPNACICMHIAPIWVIDKRDKQ